jgi:hypothetical protein
MHWTVSRWRWHAGLLAALLCTAWLLLWRESHFRPKGLPALSSTAPDARVELRAAPQRDREPTALPQTQSPAPALRISVSGRVHDDTDRPVGDVVVLIGARDACGVRHLEPSRCIVDSSGEFRDVVSAEVGGIVDVWCMTGEGTCAGHSTVRVLDKDTRVVAEFLVLPAATLDVTVHTPDGETVEGASLHVTPSSPPSALPQLTDRSGSTRLSLRPGFVTVIAKAADGREGGVVMRLEAGVTRRVAIVLDRQRVPVCVRLLSSSKELPPGSAVKVTLRTPPHQEEVLLVADGETSQAILSMNQPLTVLFRGITGRSHSLSWPNVEGAIVDGCINVHLRNRGTVTVEARDERGLPVPNLRLVLVPTLSSEPNTPTSELVTDTDLAGTATWHDVAYGAYALAVQPVEHRVHPVTRERQLRSWGVFEVSAEEVRKQVPFEGVSTVRGRYEGPTGNPAYPVEIVVEFDTNPDSPRNSRRRVAVPRIDSGEWMISLPITSGTRVRTWAESGGRPFTEVVQGESGAQGDLVIPSTGAELVLRFRRGNRVYVAGWVELRMKRGDEVFSATGRLPVSPASGRLWLPVLQPGQYEVVFFDTANGSPIPCQPAEVRLSPGTQSIELIIAESATSPR